MPGGLPAVSSPHSYPTSCCARPTALRTESCPRCSRATSPRTRCRTRSTADGPAYFDDWLPIALAVRELPDERFDDYVAALTVAGPLTPASRGMSMTRALSIAAAAVAALVLSAGAQSSARITSPVEGGYLTGPVRLTIAFEPLALVAKVKQVRWFADGRLVCTADAAPFSCEWDAGGRIEEHVIRAVAVLRDGPQIVANVRTKAIVHAEAVDVDVVQVTAVVTDSAGRFVTGLKASDFKVYEDDKPQRLTTFEVENIPLELVAASTSAPA